MNPLFAESVHAELAYLQQLLDEYSAGHKKVASRLRYQGNDASNAATARLSQAFAFLLARTQRRIDDECPQILKPLSDLIGMPGPATVPSLATVEFVVSPDQAPDGSGGIVPRGTTLESDPVRGVPIRFRTCSDVFVWPIELMSATLEFPPFRKSSPTASAATCAVRLSLRTLASNLTFSDLALDHLRFFIHGALDDALWLYHSLFADAVEVTVESTGGTSVSLSPSALSPGGFSPRESLFPGISYDGARPLVEFLSFPDKFLFFELHGLASILPQLSGSDLEINIYLRSSKDTMPRRLMPGAVRLHCTPVINLFERATSPIELKTRSDRLPLVVDSEFPKAFEIHAVNQVRRRDSKNVESELPRYHALRRFAGSAQGGPQWEYDTLEQTATTERGTVVGLRFVNENFAPFKLGDCAVSANVTCSNGDYVRELPSGDDGCLLRAEALPFVSECRCLAPPTRPRRLRLSHSMWERAEQRVPDLLTLASAQGAAALRSEIQKLACDEDVVLQSLISSLSDVRMTRSTGIFDGQMLCHGVDLVLIFRRMARLARGQLLLVRVLQDLLAQYATEGVIFRLSSQYEDGEEILRCPARSGARPVI